MLCVGVAGCVLVEDGMLVWEGVCWCRRVCVGLGGNVMVREAT